MSKNKKLAISKTSIRKFFGSIWLFPITLTLLLLLLTAFKISGSSLGVYHTLFYGEISKDNNLLINKPQSIRSDEWLVNTQMTLAQKNNDFARINKNIGNGQDLSILVDAPYKEWSVIFKPQNLAFFFIPFDNAFAFKWWFMGYLLILSCYFFVLALLPNRKLLAGLLSVGLFFAPFVQWWYLSGTLGAVSYSLLGGAILIKLFNSKKLKQSLLWGVALAYITTCFVLILYPPFQIPCILVMLAFVIGYILEKFKTEPRKMMFQRLAVIAGALVITGFITLTFLNTRSDIISTIQNTAYPGNRLQKSGGFDALHLFSSNFGKQPSTDPRAGNHKAPRGHTNQSETSNFVLILPFLLLPSLYLAYRYYKTKQEIDWSIILTSVLFLSGLIWLFIPHLVLLGKISLLERVPHARLLIGLGVLSILQIALFVKRYDYFKNFTIKIQLALLYAIAIFLVELGIGQQVMNHSPDFITTSRAIAFAIPLPIIIYLLLRKRYELAMGGLLLFSFYMTFRVNPLYQGTGALSQTPISTKIKNISNTDNSTWATEHFLLENFVFMNGAHSLSGVYSYPQLALLHDADPTAQDKVYK